MNKRSLPGSMYGDINTFSNKFGLPQPDKPEFLSLGDMTYRISFMEEELDEFRRAYMHDDLEQGLDALVDLIYVVLGTGWLMNFDIEEAWNRVHHANMQKERASDAEDPRSKRKHYLDIVKPEGWQPPYLKDLIK